MVLKSVNLDGSSDQLWCIACVYGNSRLTVPRNGRARSCRVFEMLHIDVCVLFLETSVERLR